MNNIFELSYFIKADSPEETDNFISKIRKNLEDGGAIVTDISRIEKKRLSYPIRKQTEAYFGHLKFLSKEGHDMGLLKDFFAAEPNIIRSLLVKASKSQESPRHRGARIERKAPPAQGAASEEAIDKKLEEILGA